MKTLIKYKDPILLVGDGNIVASVTMCLLNAGHKVHVCTRDVASFTQLLNKHIVFQGKDNAKKHVQNYLNIDNDLNGTNYCKLVIAITKEDIQVKRQLIKKLEGVIEKDTVIAINTESIELNALEIDCNYPSRLIGLNWTDPAHTTFFLEIIASENNPCLAVEMLILAKSFWSKDPYIVKNTGIRSRLVSAMAREASFLVDNGYASFEDIDRACRNDAGYYLPFSGNCRYMDLMGPIGYGMVMKDLNPDLSKNDDLPEFLKKILQDGGLGMVNKRGFYNYSDKDVEQWKNNIEKFSYEIHSIMEKYPFNYTK